MTGVKSTEAQYNMFEEKRKLLARYTYKDTGKPVIGIPMGLNMYELLPFWYKFFTTLGYDVKTSPASNRQLYLKGSAHHSVRYGVLPGKADARPRGSAA